MEDFKKLFHSISSLKVAVVGDIMLDTYMWGNVERISPEAPVPVVLVNKKEYRIGGAGNVALNCRALGAEVTVFSVTGDDEEGRILEQLLEQQSVNTAGITRSKERPTTNKTRIISRNQQMMRLDAEVTDEISMETGEALVKKLADYFENSNPAVLVFEDYNKGVLTEKVITEVTTLCKKHNVITAADPKRKNFFAYKEVDIFKPNLKEVKEALNLLSIDTSLPQLRTIHGALEKHLSHSTSLITMSESGLFLQSGEEAFIIPSHRRNIADVSGAGDTVIAVAAMVYAVTRNKRLMAEIANIAGGIVCEEVGTVAISKDKLLQECEHLLAK